eukprot:m.158135 g.158135  ORF g.158135 m.158135 type:complete len:875 (+) comp15127_c0_seq2:246-2870(+)
MSHKYYNTLWSEANRELRDLAFTADSAAYKANTEIAEEIPEDGGDQGSWDVAPISEPSPKDPEGAREHFGTLFIRFVLIFKKLALSYDQIVHPQKRRVLRLLMEGTMGRLLELYHTITRIECNDIGFYDDILSDLKLTPNDIEIPPPPWFRRENAKALKDRERIMDELDAEEFDPREKPAEPEPKPVTVQEAILIIQIHERARQGRLRAKFMQEIRAKEERERRQKENQDNQPKLTQRAAAIVLQKYIRGWLVRRHMKAKVNALDELIGMKMPPPLPRNKDPTLKLNDIAEKRHTTQQQYEKTYQAALGNIRKKVELVEGPDMKENMADEIRQWFMATRDHTGKFPDFPSAEDGGSKKVFDPPPPPEPEGGDEDDDGGKGKKGKGKGKKKSSKKKKDKKGSKKGKKGKKGKGDDDDEGPATFPPSEFATLAQSGAEQFQEVWEENEEDRANLHQKHDAEMIKRDKRQEVEDLLRLQVDELMREELKNLKAAVEGEKKGKKGKGKKGKGKKGKGKKGKKDKDMTADRTPESIYQELVQAGIVKKVSELPLKDFIGDFSFTARHRIGLGQNPDAAYSDIRRVMVMYGILPLGSPMVHETQPDHIKGILLVGPPGTGKKTLVNAVAHELGATFFDLTPKNTAGKFTAKKGVEGVDGMIHKVFKVAKLYQPSVVYIGNACSVHPKKKNKDDEYDSARMKKELPKVVKKNLSKGDRVIILGTEENPYDADSKGVKSVYDKVIMIPRPDYGTRLALWKHAILEEGVELNQLTDALDLSSLAKISDGYTAGDIVNITRETIGSRRLRTLAHRPLTAEEFIPGLAKKEPVMEDEEVRLKEWFMKSTPMGSALSKLQDPKDDDGGGKKKKGGKKKSGKKKKKK